MNKHGRTAPVTTHTAMADNQLLEDRSVVIVDFDSTMLVHYSQLHSDLLPVRYGDKFYRDIMTYNHVPLVAVLQHPPSPDLASTQTIVGFATGRIKASESCCHKCRGYIMTLGTSSEQRGQGIGGRLLDALIVRLKALGAVDINLHCTTTNEAAIALYISRGFTLVDRLDAHYHFNEKHHDAFAFSLFGDQTCETWCSSFFAAVRRFFSS